MSAAAVLVAVAPLMLAGCGNQSSSAASCAAPQMSASPSSVHPGQELHLTGRWFHTGCDDVVANGQTSDTERPLVDLTVRLQQGSSSWTLASKVETTTRDGLLDLQVMLPDDVRPGPATLQVTGPELGLPPSTELSVQAGG